MITRKDMISKIEDGMEHWSREVATCMFDVLLKRGIIAFDPQHGYDYDENVKDVDEILDELEAMLHAMRLSNKAL